MAVVVYRSFFLRFCLRGTSEVSEGTKFERETPTVNLGNISPLKKLFLHAIPTLSLNAADLAYFQTVKVNSRLVL